MKALRGHEAQLQQLKDLALNHKLAHTLLFLGHEGIGKFVTAQALAAYLLCTAKQELSACGVCSACGQVALGQHPDLFILSTDAEASNIKIDAVRDLLEKLKFAPYQNGGVRVVMVRDAHELSRGAANSLLKTLEEPPADTYFILTTHAYAKMLPTILSRGHKFYFSPLAAETVEEVLRQVHEGARYPKTWLALGSPGLILKWLANSEYLSHPLWKSFFKNDSAQLDISQVMDFCQKFKACPDVEAFFEWYLFNLRLQLVDKPDIDRLLLVDKTTEVMRNFAVNINPSLAMEHVLL